MPSGLRASQFAALEEPGPDEHAIRVEVDQPVAKSVAEIAVSISN